MRFSRFFKKLALLCVWSTWTITAARRLKPSSFFNIDQTEISQELQHAIRRQGNDIQTTPCSSPSSRWLQDLIEDVSEEDLNKFFEWQLHILPFVYKVYVAPRQSDQEYFGLDGEFTQEIKRIHDQAKEFWSDSGVNDEIFLLSAHGSDLADTHNKLVPTLELVFHKDYDSDYTAYDHAIDIQDLITRLPGGYTFPLLTFNAFATKEIDDHDQDSSDGDQAASIVVGDGYFKFQKAIGLDSEGPEYALTHEFSHHLQFILGVKDNKSGLDQVSKKKELMADFFSAYFLAHDQGGDMTANQLANVDSLAFSVGDCEESEKGHHGTPLQRRCATAWGAELADDKEIDKKLDIYELEARFDAWFERVDDLIDSCQYVHSAATPIAHLIPSSLQVFTFFIVGGMSMLI